MSERRACLLLEQPRGTQRYRPAQREDEDALAQAIIQLASEYARKNEADFDRSAETLLVDSA